MKFLLVLAKLGASVARE